MRLVPYAVPLVGDFRLGAAGFGTNPVVAPSCEMASVRRELHAQALGHHPSCRACLVPPFVMDGDLPVSDDGLNHIPGFTLLRRHLVFSNEPHDRIALGLGTGLRDE